MNTSAFPRCPACGHGSLRLGKAYVCDNCGASFNCDPAMLEFRAPPAWKRALAGVVVGAVWFLGTLAAAVFG
jgi:hypothetical protein